MSQEIHNYFTHPYHLCRFPEETKADLNLALEP